MGRAILHRSRENDRCIDEGGRCLRVAGTRLRAPYVPSRRGGLFLRAKDRSCRSRSDASFPPNECLGLDEAGRFPEERPSSSRKRQGDERKTKVSVEKGRRTNENGRLQREKTVPQTREPVCTHETVIARAKTSSFSTKRSSSRPRRHLLQAARTVALACEARTCASSRLTNDERASNRSPLHLPRLVPNDALEERPRYDDRDRR